MLSRIKQFFETTIRPESQSEDSRTHEHGLRLATAALLLEIGRADTEVRDEERAATESAIQRVFDLGEKETRELVALAQEEVEQSTDLYQFTRLVDAEFSAADKKHIVELMWRVSMADGHIDKYEEHLVRRIADLLHVSHADFMHAKHLAGERSGGV